MQRLLKRKAELKVIERWAKEANAWYNETIWEEEDRLRRRSEEMQEKTKKRSDLNKRMMLEIQDWAKGIREEEIREKTERKTSNTPRDEAEKEVPKQWGGRQNT